MSCIYINNCVYVFINKLTYMIFHDIQVKKSGTFKSVLLSGSVKLYTVDNSSQNSTTDFSATTEGHQQEMSTGSAVSGVESKGSNGDLRIDSVNVSTE